VCLPQEYQKIWKRKLTFPSVLYIANRYFGLIQLSFAVTLASNAWSQEACNHVYYWEPVGTLITTALSQTILGVRVHAIYGQSRYVAALLSLILLVEIVFRGYAMSTTHAPTLQGPFGPPCGSITGPAGWFIAYYATPLLYDAITFLLTAYKALEFWKHEFNTPLFTIIWRDGVLYFFAIFSMNLANVIIYLTVPVSLRTVNLTPTVILEVILSCRFILNLRSPHESKSMTLQWAATAHPSSSGGTAKTTHRSLTAGIVIDKHLHTGTSSEPPSMELGTLGTSGKCRPDSLQTEFDPHSMIVKGQTGWMA